MQVLTDSTREQSGNMMIKKQLRTAIAMIELIFAIVVMGIALLSAPMILGMSIQSANISMQQESIAATASELSLIMTHPWDEGDSNNTTGFGILRVAGGDPALNFGSRDVAYNRIFNNAPMKENASLAEDFGNGDDIPLNDIDDFHGVVSTVALYNSVSEVSNLGNNEGEYLKGANFTLTTAVDYINDAADYANGSVAFNPPFSTSGASTNIKRIRVTLTPAGNPPPPEHDQLITLSAFVCNIGNAATVPVVMP